MALAVQSLRLSQTLGDRHGAIYALELVACLAAEADRAADAATLFAAAMRLRNEIAHPVAPVDEEFLRPRWRLAPEWEEATQRALPLEDAFETALRIAHALSATAPAPTALEQSAPTASG